MEYIVFDIETSGLDPNINEIIEIGSIKIIDGVIIDEFSHLIKPINPIPDFITSLTGITNELVKDEEREVTVLQKFVEFSKEADHFLGHNIDEFDIPFLNKRLEINGLDKINKKTIDTLKIARNNISFKSVSNYKLDTLASFFNINSEFSHRAVYDAKKAWEIFKKLKDYKEEIEKCPICGYPLRMITGPYGKFIGCTGYPKCKYTRSIK